MGSTCLDRAIHRESEQKYSELLLWRESEKRESSDSEGGDR